MALQKFTLGQSQSQDFRVSSRRYMGADYPQTYPGEDSHMGQGETATGTAGTASPARRRPCQGFWSFRCQHGVSENQITQ